MIIISSDCIKPAHNSFVFIFTEWMVAQIRFASLLLVFFVSVQTLQLLLDQPFFERLLLLNFVVFVLKHFGLIVLEYLIHLFLLFELFLFLGQMFLPFS